MRRNVLLLLLSIAAGCAPTGKRAPSTASVDARAPLATLRERSAAAGSFHETGTFLVRTDREKHFLHFEAWFERPSRSRITIDLPGFPGFGSGRLTVVRDGDRVSLAREGEEGTPTEAAGDSVLAFLESYGLSPETAAYLVAPYAGSEGLFHERSLAALPRTDGDGSLRVVLKREEGGREVLDLEGPALDLAVRRVVGRDGTILMVCRYRYEEEGDLFAREVETFIPKENTRVTARFRTVEPSAHLPSGLIPPPEE